MKITIETIPHSEQRYPTVGDWVFDGEGNLSIRVSEMGNWKYEALVAMHELVEALLCKDRGITTEQVDAFDMAFEAKRPASNNNPPGEDPECPYGEEHFAAATMESALSVELGVDWIAYDDAVTEL